MRILFDNSSNPVFYAYDLNQIINDQTDFLMCALGGETSHNRIRIKRIHSCINVDHINFDKVVSHLVTTLREHNISHDDSKTIQHCRFSL